MQLYSVWHNNKGSWEIVMDGLHLHDADMLKKDIRKNHRSLGKITTTPDGYMPTDNGTSVPMKG